MAETVTCITNHTMRPYIIAPIPGDTSCPSGVRLNPGLTRVPNAFMAAWMERAVPVTDVNGKVRVTVTYEDADDVVETTDDKGKVVSKTITKRKKAIETPVLRYPGREEIETLTTKPIRRVTSQGVSFGPPLTLHREGEINEATPEGPPPPVDLPAKEEHAMRMVEVTFQADALNRWLLGEARQAVKQAIQRQLTLVSQKASQ